MKINKKLSFLWGFKLKGKMNEEKLKFAEKMVSNPSKNFRFVQETIEWN